MYLQKIWGDAMNERRKRNRTDLDAFLMLKRLDGTQIQEIYIQVTNVSTTGIGFNCYEELEKGSVYEGTLTIWTKEKLPVFVDIVRSRELEDGGYNYGALFVGMPELYSRKISVYQTVEETKLKR